MSLYFAALVRLWEASHRQFSFALSCSSLNEGGMHPTGNLLLHLRMEVRARKASQDYPIWSLHPHTTSTFYILCGMSVHESSAVKMHICKNISQSHGCCNRKTARLESVAKGEAKENCKRMKEGFGNGSVHILAGGQLITSTIVYNRASRIRKFV